MQEQIRNILCGRAITLQDEEAKDPVMLACGHFATKDFKKVIEVLQD
jgi:hypothetical protein